MLADSNNSEKNAQTPSALQLDTEQGSIPQEPVKNDREKSPSKGLIITIAILALTTLASIGFGVYEMVKANSTKPQTAVETQNTDDSTATQTTENTRTEVSGNAIATNNSASNDADEVKSLISNLRKVAAEKFGVGESYFYRTYEDGSMVIIPGTDIKTKTNESYSFNAPNRDLEMQFYKELPDLMKETLTNNGFVFSERFDKPIDWISLYYNSEKDIYCTVPEISSWYSVDCTKTSWLSEEKKALTLELLELAGDWARNTLDADPNKIEDSPVAPYQRLHANTNNATLLFYRNSPNEKWQFATAMQGTPPCDAFNEDAKKAFAGEKCYNQTTQTEETL